MDYRLLYIIYKRTSFPDFAAALHLH
jgi:hypothetical protein